MTKDTKKFIKKISKDIHAQIEEAFDLGFALGSEDSTEEYTSGFNDGALAERERIKAIFDMNIQWAIESNKGSEVIFFTKAKQIIDPIEVDFSPEAYQRELEKDGF